jgi:hypothetical protein
MSRLWCDIDWEAARPTPEKIERSRSRVEWRPAPVTGPAVERMMAELARTHANGGALLARFRAENSDDVLHWFMARNRLNEYRFFEQLFASQVVQETLPDLDLAEAIARNFGVPEAGPGPQHYPFGQRGWGTLTLEGELAATIVHGGAYERFPGRPVEAKKLAAEFVAELIGDRYEDCELWRPRGNWSNWFRLVAWDSTWIIIDNRRLTVTILCATDED